MIGFAVGCMSIISWAGKTFFEADVTFEEMVRTLGLAYVWNIIGFLGIVGAGLAWFGMCCGPIGLAAGIAGLVAWFIAAKEALDLEWPQTIGTVVIGWVASFIVSLIAGAILGYIRFSRSGDWVCPARTSIRKLTFNEQHSDTAVLFLIYETFAAFIRIYL